MAKRELEKWPVCCGQRMLFLGDQHTFEGGAESKRDNPKEPFDTLEYACGECRRRATVHHQKEDKHA